MRPVEKRIKDCLRVIEWSKVRSPNLGVGYPTLDEATQELLVFLNGPDNE
jgi:hypothetical protein